jgi:hypothetical protein
MEKKNPFNTIFPFVASKRKDEIWEIPQHLFNNLPDSHTGSVEAHSQKIVL